MGTAKTQKRKKPAGTSRKSRPADAVWLSPSAFERWLKSQGVVISHKSLYKTYLGAGARYPVKRNARNYVHREQGLELIRLVQAKEPVSIEASVATRAEATARVQIAKARILEREEQLAAGTVVPMALVNQVWPKAITNLKNELMSLPTSLSSMLVGKSEVEIEGILRQRLLDSMRHMADGWIKAKAAL